MFMLYINSGQGMTANNLSL